MKSATLLSRPALLLLALLLALPAVAQPFADQVPEDAAIYFGWRGAEDMGPAYEGSNMQGVLEQTGLFEALPELFQSLTDVVEAEAPDPDAAVMLGHVGTLWGSMWDNGGALYMLPPEQGGPPIPRLAILFGKGENERQVRSALRDLVDRINEAEQLPAFTGEVGDALYLSLVFDAGQVAGDTLDESERFSECVSHVQGDGALMVFVDVREWVFQVDQFAMQAAQQAEDRGEQDNPAARWPAIRDILGLDQMDSMMASGGIAEDGNWHTRMYIQSPAPREGLLSIVENQPLTSANLAHVPRTATHVRALSMDPAQVMDLMREVLAEVDVEMVADLNEGLEDIRQEIGVEVEADLIRGMGPVWTFYVDPMIAGNGFGSMVLVNELSDADGVEAALLRLTEVANAALMDEQQGDDVNIQLLTRVIDGQRITHLGIPGIAPAWMVHDGRLYVSLYPQGLEMALDQSGEIEDSILTNEVFQETMARFISDGGADADELLENLGPAMGLSFANLPETVADGYSINMMMMQLIGGFGEMTSGRPTSLRMPPVGRILPFIEPTGGVTWFDEDGMHMHSIEPFPGSAAFSATGGLEGTAVMAGPMAIAILLPALGGAEDAALQTHSLSNIRAVGVANMAYAIDHDGHYASDIAVLNDYTADSSVFFSPQYLDRNELPADIDRRSPDTDAYLRAHSAYVLVPLGTVDRIEDPAQAVLVFQRPDTTDADLLAVAMADGSVQVMTGEALAQRLEDQAGTTPEALIRRQEAGPGDRDQ